MKICNTDIVLISDNARFICVIENKIAAKIQADTNCTQIEKYKKETNDKYPDYDKAFVFICANNDTYPNENFIKHCSCTNYNGKYKDKNVKDLLDDNQYIILEHYDIVQILYNYLLKNETDLFENNILIPTSKFNDEVFKILGNKEVKAREKIPFMSILKDKEYKQIIYLLCQYIEYCELHRTCNAETDNFIPYTKIVDKNLLWNICCDIKNENQNTWEDIKKQYYKYLPNIE